MFIERQIYKKFSMIIENGIFFPEDFDDYLKKLMIQFSMGTK